MELQGVEYKELDDEPKEKDATYADDGPPWTKGESLSQLKKFLWELVVPGCEF